MAKNIKKCRYIGCKHDKKEIDLDKDEYIQVGNKFYHTDCKGICKYSYCKHPNREIDFLNEEYIITDNGNCWHKECKKEDDAVKEIIDCWYRNISDDDVDLRNLRRIVNTMLKKGIEAEYILFALKKKLNVVKHPPGLYYLIDDYRIIDAWKKKKIDEEMKNAKFEKPTNYSEPTFSAKPVSGTKFTDIFGGKW